MRSSLIILLVAVVIPASLLPVHSVLAAPASFRAGQSLVAASSSPGNAYAVGASVVLTAPVAGDFLALGGSIITAAPVEGDDLMFGGSVSSRSRVTGDLRAIGGSVEIVEPILGDLVVGGLSVRDSGRAGGSVFIIALNTVLSSGASGPVTIYGNNISLAGDFASDVNIVASGHISLSPGTLIHGKFSYEAPDVASIPTSASILRGVVYTNASYLPDVGTSRFLAFVSIGFFLVVRIIGALILAGLLAGLFSNFAKEVTGHVLHMRVREMLLLLLLGFGIGVATPVVIGLLLLTFVGIGIAFLVAILYALLFLLAFMYTGIVMGSILSRRFLKREQVLWHDGILGMTIVSLVLLVPYIGVLTVCLFTFVSVGTLLQIFFRFAFPHDTSVHETL
jgi:hypothetical protein